MYFQGFFRIGIIIGLASKFFICGKGSFQAKKRKAYGVMIRYIFFYIYIREKVFSNCDSRQFNKIFFGFWLLIFFFINDDDIFCVFFQICTMFSIFCFCFFIFNKIKSKIQKIFFKTHSTTNSSSNIIGVFPFPIFFCSSAITSSGILRFVFFFSIISKYNIIITW